MERKHGLDTYKRLKKQHPAYFQAVETLGAVVRQAGPLDERSLQLIQLAAGGGSAAARWAPTMTPTRGG